MKMENDKNLIISTIQKKCKESFIISLLLAIFAIILLINPDNFMNVLIQVVGYACLLFGTLSIISYFRLDKTKQLLSNNLLNGLLLCVFGCTTFIQTIMVKDLLTILLGGYLVFKNASRVQMIMQLNDGKNMVYISFLILSLLNVFIGFLVIVNPFEFMKVHVFLAVSLLIAEGLVVIQNLLLLLFAKKGNVHE